MSFEQDFDLKLSLEKSFPDISLGGDLIDQWTTGIRFDIGLSEIGRAVSIYDATFLGAESVVLFSEDSSWSADPTRWYGLFSLPALFLSSNQPKVNSYEITDSENETYTISWAIISPSIISRERLFQAIANQDHGGVPSVRGRIHVFDPHAEILLHMYDDRGMDVIGSTALPLLDLKKQFATWINRDKLRDAYTTGEQSSRTLPAIS
jgi:Domain of unknown function (DUF3885)